MRSENIVMSAKQVTELCCDTKQLLNMKKQSHLDPIPSAVLDLEQKKSHISDVSSLISKMQRFFSVNSVAQIQSRFSSCTTEIKT